MNNNANSSSVHTDVLIIGAGPGGLACAKVLAQSGRQVMVVERKKCVGPKVCAGGITWDGLINIVPKHLIERTFNRQHIVTRHQQIVVQEKDPIIATINRETLGQWMAEQAIAAGATLLTATRVTGIDQHQVRVCNANGKIQAITCAHLVGADGAQSMVRRSLGIATKRIGPGINYQIPGRAKKMEWHLNTNDFGYGYGWIFPHKNTVSIGTYGPAGNMPALTLKKKLITWATRQGYNLENQSCQAAMINYDYQGYSFDKTWLVGDAAGLASGLTGEGIHPAIVSGETVARKILDPSANDSPITEMVIKQLMHHRVINLSARHPAVCSLLMESLVFMLRLGVVNFQALEMTTASNN